MIGTRVIWIAAKHGFEGVFGFGDTGPIITVVLTGIPFVIINVREGVRNTPTDLYDMARAFKVPRPWVIRAVLIPSLMPFLFAAARYCFALGWKGLVVAEVRPSGEHLRNQHLLADCLAVGKEAHGQPFIDQGNARRAMQIVRIEWTRIVAAVGQVLETG